MTLKSTTTRKPAANWSLNRLEQKAAGGSALHRSCRRRRTGFLWRTHRSRPEPRWRWRSASGELHRRCKCAPQPTSILAPDPIRAPIRGIRRPRLVSNQTVPRCNPPRRRSATRPPADHSIVRAPHLGSIRGGSQVNSAFTINSEEATGAALQCGPRQTPCGVPSRGRLAGEKPE